ncbi:helix-turn-helix domain-containing protein [Mycolicibacterium llatzerense]|uniref:helix-turn-helix domain-containing protein n=2 Tax=Mycolicibacterium llatzerense TaxID=280871 RepID=UPI0021B4D530|nr:helix-turn-helix transcriptional regulator [Mycolicibacterium llatzerense]
MTGVYRTSRTVASLPLVRLPRTGTRFRKIAGEADPLLTAGLRRLAARSDPRTRINHEVEMSDAPWCGSVAAVEGQQLANELRERLPKDAAETSIKELALTRQHHESWEKRFGEVVRSWRQDRNWSQDEVAERLRHQGFEMHQTTVAKIERGARPLRVAEAAALAEVFEMPIMAVFELSLPDDHTTQLESHRIEGGSPVSVDT